MTKVDEAVETAAKLLGALTYEAENGPTQMALVTPDNARKSAEALALILSALKVRTEALEEIKRGGFNCSPHQWFMAAQGRAEAALSQDPKDKTHG